MFVCMCLLCMYCMICLQVGPQREEGKFYFVVKEQIPVRLSPEDKGVILRYIEPKTVVAADVRFTLPNTSATYLRLMIGEKGWISMQNANAVDLLDETTGIQGIAKKVFSTVSNINFHGSIHRCWAARFAPKP